MLCKAHPHLGLPYPKKTFPLQVPSNFTPLTLDPSILQPESAFQIVNAIFPRHIPTLH